MKEGRSHANIPTPRITDIKPRFRLTRTLRTKSIPLIHYQNMYNKILQARSLKEKILIPKCRRANASNDFYPLLRRTPMRKSARKPPTTINDHQTIDIYHQFAPSLSFSSAF